MMLSVKYIICQIIVAILTSIYSMKVRKRNQNKFDVHRDSTIYSKPE